MNETILTIRREGEEDEEKDLYAPFCGCGWVGAPSETNELAQMDLSGHKIEHEEEVI